MKPFQITAALAFLATASLADSDQNLADSQAILAELRNASETCEGMNEGQITEEIFGIKMIRIGDTCVIINGDEIDQSAREFLEEKKLPWAGVGLWVKANPGMD